MDVFEIVIALLVAGAGLAWLVLGDWTHIPFKPPIQSEVVTLTVKADAAAAKPTKTAMIAEAKEKHRHHRHHHH